jgi:hypothetical protein
MDMDNFFDVEVNWDEIQTGALPSGQYLAKWVSVKVGERSQSGRQVIRASWKILEPLQYAGSYHNETFTIGSSEPDRGEEIDPTSFGLKRFKQAVAASGLHPKGRVSLASLAEQLIGRTLVLILKQTIEPFVLPDGTENEFGGTARTRLSGVLPDETYSPEPTRHGPPLPLPETRTQPLAPSTTVTATTDLEISSPAQAPSAPRSRKAPAAARPPQIPSQPVPEEAPSADSVPCGICRKLVPPDEYAQHVIDCMARSKAR